MIPFSNRFTKLFSFRSVLWGRGWGWTFSTKPKTEKCSLDLIMERLKLNTSKCREMEQMLIDASIGELKVHINP
jgi:hypothetical protein